jgi:hypothetical protein
MKSFKEFSESNGARIDVNPGTDNIFDVIVKSWRMLTKMPIVSFNFNGQEMTMTKEKYMQIVDFIKKTLAN